VQLFTLHFCSLQEDKTDNVRTCDVILRGVRANIGGFRSFGEALLKWGYYKFMGKQQLVGNGVNLVVRGKVSLTINIVLSEKETEFSAVLGTL